MLAAYALPGFAGAEHRSRILQLALNSRCERVRAPKHTARGPIHLLERRHTLTEIVQRGTVVHVECLRVNQPHLAREIVTISENASRRGQRFAKKRLGFIEALR